MLACATQPSMQLKAMFKPAASCRGSPAAVTTHYVCGMAGGHGAKTPCNSAYTYWHLAGRWVNTFTTTLLNKQALQGKCLQAAAASAHSRQTSKSRQMAAASGP